LTLNYLINHIITPRERDRLLPKWWVKWITKRGFQNVS